MTMVNFLYAVTCVTFVLGVREEAPRSMLLSLDQINNKPNRVPVVCDEDNNRI